jgi:hypothetical protein
MRCGATIVLPGVVEFCFFCFAWREENMCNIDHSAGLGSHVWTSSKPEHNSVCFETFRPPIKFERPVDRIAQVEFDLLFIYADSRSRSANHVVSTSGRAAQHSALEPVKTKEAQIIVSQKL